MSPDRPLNVLQVCDHLGWDGSRMHGVKRLFAWMIPRFDRTRFNVSYSLSDDVSLTGVSVYGTPESFRGDASPGDSLTVNAAWEYSVTRNWVLALDVVYQHFDSTRVSGQVSDAGGASQPFDQTFASGWQTGLAPAIEYNWSSRVGVIFGTRWFAAGRNADASLTPVVAINMVY